MPVILLKALAAFVPAEKLPYYLLAAIAVPLALIVLLFAVPVVIHERVPLAKPSQVRLYVEAAEMVSDSTKTACDSEGLTVNWQLLLAIEAVRLGQDFRLADAARADDLARRFVERAGTVTCGVSGGAAGGMIVAATYRLRDLDEVMDDLGLSNEEKDRARTYASIDLAFLRDVGTACAPAGWVPREGTWTWPTPGNFTVTSCFGPRHDPIEGVDGKHDGLDIAADTGDPVVAAGPGEVVLASGISFGACGKTVRIQHPDGVATRYCHLDRVVVRRGQEVEAGEVIGAAGSTGRSTGPHLHFEVRRGGVAKDPIASY